MSVVYCSEYGYYLKILFLGNIYIGRFYFTSLSDMNSNIVILQSFLYLWYSSNVAPSLSCFS